MVFKKLVSDGFSILAEKWTFPFLIFLKKQKNGAYKFFWEKLKVEKFWSIATFEIKAELFQSLEDIEIRIWSNWIFCSRWPQRIFVRVKDKAIRSKRFVLCEQTSYKNSQVDRATGSSQSILGDLKCTIMQSTTMVNANTRTRHRVLCVLEVWYFRIISVSWNRFTFVNWINFYL